MRRLLATCLLLPILSPAADAPINISGVYPGLVMYNNEGECGTGAVVPWADRLWVVTYAPHKPLGSSDKLYEISNDLTQTIRPESIGGTPANRMIHRESDQLIIGPYFIDKDRTVRAIPYSRMPGRPTGTARHLTDPANKVYYATMEEGLYEVDVHDLSVTEFIKDGNGQKAVGQGITTKLPGYHGKGLYSSQGLLVYANNGEHGKAALTDPTTPSGALATWQGSGDWSLVRRNQFTEVTGPGGIYGNSNSNDPLWAMGWDARSLILMLLENGAWHPYRLPKGSHSYDGAHGWNTEWPRIRDIGEESLLATMHGTFWQFPKTFSTANSAGIKPRSNYLKVIGDFTAWNGKIVLGCDDSAKSEFLNSRPFKSTKAAPVQSNSNLWFIDSARLDNLGPAIGRGSVWLRDDVEAGAVSDPFLFSGYDHRMVVIHHQSSSPVTITLEVDHEGNGNWVPHRKLTAAPSAFHVFTDFEKGVWIRARTESKVKGLTVHFHYRNNDPRGTENNSIFDPIAKVGEKQATAGLVRSNSKVMNIKTAEDACYQVDATMAVARADADLAVFKGVESPANVIEVDAASAIVVEDGKTYRLPKNDAYAGDLGRISREVATERDLFNFHGTFYELPARNAQGFAKIRPIATHNLNIADYGSHFGLIFITGLSERRNHRVLASADGAAAAWAGVIDDLWKLGKPRGQGGPWKDTQVKANVPSDAYLMTGYDKKSVVVSAAADTEIGLEVDVDGTGLWVPYTTLTVKADAPVAHAFPDGFSAYWVRAIADRDTTATAQFTYE